MTTGVDVVVGVDLGSSSARALAVDRDGMVRGSSRAPYPAAETWPAGRAEPAAFEAAVRAALDGLRIEPAAICIGGQSPTTVPADGGGLAVTCRHPAGAEGDPVAQHRAQWDVLGRDVEPRQLWDWVLERLGAEPHQGRWPGDPALDGYGAVRDTGTVVGATAGGAPLVAGAQDAYLGFWAGGTDVPGRGLDPGGRTGGLAVAVAAGARPDGMYALASAARRVDIVGGPVNGHGLMVEWLASLTGRPVDELLALAAKAEPGAGGVTVLPYLEGERAPRWNRALRAQVAGLTNRTGLPELARAVLEASAYGLAHIAAGLRDAGVAIDVVVCGGSPARSRLWCGIKAAVLEVPVEVPSEPDLAAYGAALGAGAGIGWWPAPGRGESGSWPRPAMERIEPEPSPAYRDGYRRFVELGDEQEARPCPTR